jgi:hypothetical protein
MAQQQEPVTQQPPRVPAVQHPRRAQLPPQRPSRLICHATIVTAADVPGMDAEPASMAVGKGTPPLAGRAQRFGSGPGPAPALGSVPRL